MIAYRFHLKKYIVNGALLVLYVSCAAQYIKAIDLLFIANSIAQIENHILSQVHKNLCM